MSIDTSIKVQVAAVDGKYLGDDIGGAEITIRDARTKEVLAQGITTGTSGPTGVMCSSIQRGQPLPTDGTTSAFIGTIPLTLPRQVEVTAFGPLAARGSANTASITTWVYPGKDIIAGNGILLQLPGLICQIINPPTHTVISAKPATFDIIANVAMMCGCPISVKSGATDICPGASNQPWDPSDFEVCVVISQAPKVHIQRTLSWNAGSKVAGQFTVNVSDIPAGIYKMYVYAQQISTGNTGVDLSTFIVKDPNPATS